MNIGDTVLTQTTIIKCRLLGTIKEIIGNTYIIELHIPIKGHREVRAIHGQMQLIPKPKKKPVQNKKIKRQSSNIIEKLYLQSEPEQPNKTKRIEPASGNWLDYMKENKLD